MKAFFVLVFAGTALWISACSSGSITVQPPPPVGKYSLASLNGQYVFGTSGEVFASGANVATPLARTGVFSADGMGHITGGIEDVNADGVVSNAITITNTSSYTVNADGRGTLTLDVNAAGIQNTLNFGIVLTSANDGLLIDETSTTLQASTGSGNFVKQKGGSFLLSDFSGNYVFDFLGLDAANGPDSIVGEFNVTAAGVVSGVQDENDNGSLPPTLSPISFVGSIAQDPLSTGTLQSFGRGVAQLNGLQYIFYIVDASRVRLLSSNSKMLSGDAILQLAPPATPGALNGGFAFIVGGSSANGGLTRIGRFSLSGGAVTNILMDVNDAGTFRQPNTFTNATFSLDSVNPGRGFLSFQDNTLSYTFVFYLSSQKSGVIQDVSLGSGGLARAVADGSLAAQSGSPFTSSNISGTYALNWSGLLQAGGTFAVQDEQDVLAQMTVANLTSVGTADIFDFIGGVPQFDKGVSGSISISGDGTSSDGTRNGMTVNLSGASPIHLVVYFVNPNLAFFANRDNSGAVRIVAGILKTQQ
jgi:hypothetical protein